MKFIPKESSVDEIMPTTKETTEYFRQLYKLLNQFVKSYADNNDYIYHYTNVDALLGGLIPEDINADLCFRATNVKYMNDPEELKPDYEKIIETAKQSEVLKQGYESMQSLNYQFNDSFVISFSENEDFLPMWSMYGKDGNGVVLAFKKDELTTEYPPIKCIYRNSQAFEDIIKLSKLIFNDRPSYIRGKFFIEIHKIVHREKTTSEAIAYLRSITPKKSKAKPKVKSNDTCDCNCDLANLINEMSASMLLAVMPILAYKHEAYEYEKELRLLFQEEASSKVKYRSKNGMMIPYIETPINRNALRYIVVGPTLHFKEAEQSQGSFLKFRGLEDVEIKQSIVSYRGN